jgi:hypothetical protein
MEGEQQNKPIDDKSNTSLPDTQIVVLDNSNSNTDPDLLSHSSKKQKKTEESQVLNSQNHQDILLNGKNADYRSFSTTNKKPSKPIRSNPIEEILHQAETVTSDLDSDEDEQKKKIAAAKKLLFPSTLATSFPEVVDTLRNERRQEFCPIYTDETPEQMTLRLAKRKPIGSLLAKRIRWDDLKRKREENERQAQVSVRYGPYGPIYSNQQASFSNTYGNMQNQPQQSFANPYEQYYAAVNSQYEQVYFSRIFIFNFSRFLFRWHK